VRARAHFSFVDDRYGNGMTGTIPTEIGRFRSVTYLGLGSNSLSGTVPSELGLLATLTHLHLWQNRLSGTLPSQLGRLAPRVCNLAEGASSTACGNQFACPIPTLLTACAASATCTDTPLPCYSPPPSAPPSAPLQPPPAMPPARQAIPLILAYALGGSLACALAVCIAIAWRTRRCRRSALEVEKSVGGKLGQQAVRVDDTL